MRQAAEGSAGSFAQLVWNGYTQPYGMLWAKTVPILCLFLCGGDGSCVQSRENEAQIVAPL